MKNWKTTICGIAIAAATVIQNYNGPNTKSGWIQAAAIAALGFFAKDYNQSGTLQ